MSVKEKAEEYFKKMKGFRVKHSHSKKCAIILVEELIKELRDSQDNYDIDCSSPIRYYNEVLDELKSMKTK